MKHIIIPKLYICNESDSNCKLSNCLHAEPHELILDAYIVDGTTGKRMKQWDCECTTYNFCNIKRIPEGRVCRVFTIGVTEKFGRALVL